MPEEGRETGLPDLLDAVRRRWRLGLLVFVAIFIGAFAYAHVLPRAYTAKTIVALTPRPNSGATAIDVTQLGQKYVAYVTAPTTISTVAAQVGVGQGTLQRAVTASIATASVNLTIDVELGSARDAQAAANALASSAESFSTNDKLLVAQTVSPATLPLTPSKPRRALIEGAGLLLGLVIAVVVAIVVERSRPRVHSAMEASYVTGHGVIGRLPRSRSIRGGVDRALADPLVGGAIRSLRTVLDHDARVTPVHTIIVTSSTPGEGKSTVAAALASAIARLDARVLLIDGDLRHPSVASLFDLPFKPGLAEMVRGQATMDACVRAVPHIPGLFVLPTSGIAETGDLLARSVHTVLGAARNSYDVVLVDSPPLLVGDDTGILATQADAVLMVVSTGVETRRLGEAARSLDALGVRVIGVVLNRAHIPGYAYTYGAAGTRGHT